MNHVEKIIIERLYEEICRHQGGVENSLCYTTDLSIEDIRFKQGILMGYRVVEKLIDKIKKDYSIP